MKLIKYFKILTISILVVLILFSIVYFVALKPKIDEFQRVRNMFIQDYDLEQIKDGSYIGKFKYTDITIGVQVRIEKSKIDDIYILDDAPTPQGKKANNIINNVLEKQSLHVDVISGATISSKAILKAIENALAQGLIIEDY